MTHTLTPQTPVSIQVGSDRYAARIVRATARTVVVASGALEREETFRWRSGRWRSGSKRRGYVHLVIGVSETVLDPAF